MSRRRQHRHLRLTVLIPALFAGAAAWIWWREPAQWAGLAACLIAGLCIWPPLVLGVLMIPSALHALLVPPSWRAAHRKRRKDRGEDRGRAGYVPHWLRLATFRADLYRCVFCKTRRDLQWDHYRPFALGGQVSLGNGLTLCGRCNRVKADFWQDPDGYVHYHPFAGAGNIKMAAQILAAERQARRNPLRWLRMAWSLS